MTNLYIILKLWHNRSETFTQFLNFSTTLKLLLHSFLAFTQLYTFYTIFRFLRDCQSFTALVDNWFDKNSLELDPYLSTFYLHTLHHLYLYINLACLSVCLSVCLFVCLYPINVKTAEPIGPKFFVGHHVTTGKVYEW